MRELNSGLTGDCIGCHDIDRARAVVFWHQPYARFVDKRVVFTCLRSQFKGVCLQIILGLTKVGPLRGSWQKKADSFI